MAAVVRLPVRATTAPGARPSWVSVACGRRATPLPTSGDWAPATWSRTVSVREEALASDMRARFRRAGLHERVRARFGGLLMDGAVQVSATVAQRPCVPRG